MPKPSELLAAPAARLGTDRGLHRPDPDRRGAGRRGRGGLRAAGDATARQEARASPRRSPMRRLPRPKPDATAKRAKPEAVRHASAKPDADAEAAESPSPPADKPAAASRRSPRPAKKPKPEAQDPAGRSARRAPELTSLPANRPLGLRPLPAIAAACHRRPHCSILTETAPSRSGMPARRRDETQRGNTMERIWLKQYPPGVPADIDADPIRLAGRVAGGELCEVRRPQGLHLHGQVDQLSRPRRDVAGARRLSCRARACKRAPASR